MHYHLNTFRHTDSGKKKKKNVFKLLDASEFPGWFTVKPDLGLCLTAKGMEVKAVVGISLNEIQCKVQELPKIIWRMFDSHMVEIEFNGI